jgi:excisionase family DNA binding protein
MTPGVAASSAHLISMDTISNPLAALEPLLSTQELAEYLGVPVKTIYEWRTGGHGPCAVRVGRHLKFAVSDVQAWVAQQREASPGLTAERRRAGA